jgi:hypothetical protein
MRVLGRRGLGPFRLAIVWPVVTVEVLPGMPDSRKFTLDIRELVTDGPDASPQVFRPAP